MGIVQIECSIDNCEGKHLAKGLCSKHYKRKKRNGDPAIVFRVRDLSDEKRFWLKVDKQSEDECWLWIAGTTFDGYGEFRLGATHVRAHRYAYELLIKQIPDRLSVDHLCHNKLCVNPAHMEIVTMKENVRRRWIYYKETGWHPRRRTEKYLLRLYYHVLRASRLLRFLRSLRFRGIAGTFP